MPDVNVLLYAHRSDELWHDAYRSWLEETVNGREPFALSVLVAVGFVRIATNPRIYPTPTPLALALASVDALLERPTCRLVGPGPRHLALVGDLCRAVGAAGKSVADAQHAALAIEHGCTWVSRDGDFAAFAEHGLGFEHLVLGR
jgi:hypothetical protein